MSSLPEPVLPVFSACPYTSVFLFVSSSSIYLCRRSGQLVWTAKRVITDPVKTVVWSPDKAFFALVYTSHTYSVHRTSSGRIATDSDCSGAECVAWSPSGLLDSTSRPSFGLSKTYSKPAVNAVGTVNGEVVVKLCRSLELPSVYKGLQPVTYISFDETRGSLDFLEGRTLRHYTVPKPETSKRRKPAIFSTNELEIEEEEPNELVPPLVSSDEMLECLISGWESARNKCLEYFTLNNAFFASLLQDPASQAPQNACSSNKNDSIRLEFMLSRAMLFGVVPQIMIDWIQLQHEQGFIKWYKQVQTRLESVKTYLQYDFLLLSESLLMNYRIVGADPTTVSELVDLGYELMHKIVEMALDFENVAPYIQYLFVNETDRPIAVTKNTEIDMSVAIESLQSTFFKDSGLNQVIQSLDKRTKVARTEFSRVLETESMQLSSLFKQSWEFEFSSEVKSIKKIGNTFQAILGSNKLVNLSEGKILNELDIDNTFLFQIEGVVGRLETNSLVISNGINVKTIDLEIDAGGVETRIDGSSIVACVLSSDCTKFQVVEFSI